MLITKIFNNNSALAIDKDKKEYVVMGCGLAFKKKVGDTINEKLIEKTFTLKQKDASEKFRLLLEDIPIEHVELSYDIIEYAKSNLDVELNDYIYVTLTDHISYTIKLFKEGIIRPNVLIWEIKRFYPKEYKMGLKALEFIKDETDCDLHEDEAGNIALHLLTAQVNNKYKNVQDVYNVTKKIQDILNIVKYSYNIELDENSLNYERFVTHLRFFFKRLDKREIIESDDDFLFEQIKKKYSSAFQCMGKIEKFLNIDLSKDEQLYLTLHIQRVTHR